MYYETVRDAMSCEDARDVIAEKYPNRNVIAVQGRKTPDEGDRLQYYWSNETPE